LGIIHRDLKPSNILINAQPNGKTIRLLIADFSSAIDDKVEALGLYGELGPTIDEVCESQSFIFIDPIGERAISSTRIPI
jgi:serine/threonine protein kinase